MDEGSRYRHEAWGRVMKARRNNQRGSVLVIFVILLVVLLGFTALATEAGRWYLVRSELSKAADAAAIAGAKNISNPYVTVEAISQEIARENFPAGQLGTPRTGEGAASFSTVTPGNNKVQVDATASALAILARLFGIQRVPAATRAVAQVKPVEIMMVLDKSGSMSGQPLTDLRAAALSFLNFFKETEDRDKMGLISFATGVTVNHRLSTYFVNDMTAKINTISAQTGKQQFTNAEDAINRSDDQAAGGFTDMSFVPEDQRVQQYLIFFTDGNPNAFRHTFTYRNTVYDAVAYTEGSFGSCTDYICGSDRYLCHPDTGNSLGIPVLPSGDGKPSALSSCHISNTKWHVFGEYPVAGYGPEACNIPESKLRPNWFKNAARQMAINHAQELKDKHIKIYVIGLGHVDESFIGEIASGPEFQYYTPSSDELETIFNLIAKHIKLRLVE
jgi:Flp pilus assembly protein TadG